MNENEFKKRNPFEKNGEDTERRLHGNTAEITAERRAKFLSDGEEIQCDE